MAQWILLNLVDDPHRSRLIATLSLRRWSKGLKIKAQILTECLLESSILSMKYPPYNLLPIGNITVQMTVCNDLIPLR